MDQSRRIAELEAENRALKAIVADAVALAKQCQAKLSEERERNALVFALRSYKRAPRKRDRKAKEVPESIPSNGPGRQPLINDPGLLVAVVDAMREKWGVGTDKAAIEKLLERHYEKNKALLKKRYPTSRRFVNSHRKTLQNQLSKARRQPSET